VLLLAPRTSANHDGGRQKHSARTDRTIVGLHLWPSYTLKSLGLFLLIFGVLAAMGGFLQIAPIWIYGPDSPAGILPGAQPDWYLGWIEDAMRLFPGVNISLGTVLVPELFFPAVLFPVLVFTALYAYPFVERLHSPNGREHHVLSLPWRRPWQTSFGCAVLALLVVLEVAGGDDVIAVAANQSVIAIRAWLRVLVFVAPIITWFVAYDLCRRARRRHLAREQAIPLAGSAAAEGAVADAETV